LDLRWAASQLQFPPKQLNNFLKVSYTENDMLPGMKVETLPQLVHIRNGTFTYMEQPHTK